MRRGYRDQGYAQPTMVQPSGFGSLTHTQAIPEYYGMPMEDIQRVSSILYERHEQNRLAFEELATVAELDKQKVRDMDRGIIDESINRVNSATDQFVQGKNYHNAGAALSKSFREYTTDEMRAAAITARAKQLEFREQIEAREDLPQPYKNMALAVSNSAKFNTAITRNEDGTVSGGFVGFNPAEYVDPKELIDKYLKDWKMDKTTIEGWDTSSTGQDPWIRGMVQSVTGISDEEFISGVTNLLMGDDKYKAWIDSKYILENSDTETGEINVPNEVQMVDSFFRRIPTKTPDGKEIPVEQRRQDAQDELEGALLSLQNEYFRVYNTDLDRNTALQMLHKQDYMQSNINNAIMSLHEPYVHQVIERRSKIMKDHIHAARYQKSLDSLMDAHYIGSGNAGIDPNELRQTVATKSRELADINAGIANIESQLLTATGTHKESLSQDLAARIKQRDRLSAELSTRQMVLSNLTNQLSDDDIKAKVREGLRAFGGLRVLRDQYSEDDIVQMIKNNELYKLSDALEKETEPTNKSNWLFGPAAVREQRRQQVAKANLYHFKLFENSINELYNNIDPERLNYHQNFIVLTPEGNHAARQRENIEMRIKTGTPYETFDGRSSTDKNFQKELGGYEDLRFDFIADNVNGDMLGLVTYLDENERPIGTPHMIDLSTFVTPQATVGNWRDMAVAAQSDEYRRHPEMAHNLITLSKGGLAGLEPVFYEDATLGSTGQTLREAFRALGVEGYNTNETTIENPITVKRGNKDIKIAFRKTSNGVQPLYFDTTANNGNGGYLPITNTSFPNVEGALPYIYDELEALQPLHNLFIYGN